MKKSSKISLCGMMCALSIVFMFLTGVFPYATYALPALAGLTLIVLVIETSKKWAFVAYLLIAPDRMAVLLFMIFFGYYPILKSMIETRWRRISEWVCKLLLFNAAVGAAYLLMQFFVSAEDIFVMFGKYGILGIIVGILFLNVVFVIYDIAVSRVITAYIHWFRPRYLRKLR